MPRKNTDVPTEFISAFTLRIFHSFEPLSYVIEVPELNCRFTSTTLANATANSLQGLLYHLHEREKRIERLRPGHPV